MAGGSGYCFNRFLLFDLVGETTWFIVFGGLGYELGSQWPQAQTALSNLNGPVVGVALAGIAVLWSLRKAWRRARLQVQAEIRQPGLTTASG